MERLIYKIVFFVYLLFSVQGSFGQEMLVRGKVTDAADNEPIIGGTIVEVDEEQRIIKGTVTNVNGDYAFEVTNSSAKLVFSYVGYKSQEINLAGRSTLNVALEGDIVQLEGVVIVADQAYTDPITNVSERDRTGSSVKLEILESTTAGVTSLEDAMQGQMSGVSIVGSGDPGSGGSIVIRGLGTLGNSEPLIVLDGIPQDVRADADFDFSTADVEDIGQLVSIAPQDIKSIEVLKDASTTAIWGSKGANGVIQIETKRGAFGKTKFTYQLKRIWSIPKPYLPMLNGDEYIMLQLEELHAPTGIYSLPPELSGDPRLLGKDFYNYTQNTDWQEAVTQNGLGNDHYFQVNGGGQKTNYYGSISYLDESGTTINTGYKRLTSRVNFNYKISNKLNLESRISYTYSARDDNYTSTFKDKSNRTNIRRAAIRKAPNMSIYEYDALGNITDEFFSPIMSYQGSGKTWYNPVAMGLLSDDDKEDNKVESTFSLSYKMFKWMRFQETVSYTYLNSKRNRFLPSNAIGVDWLDQENNYARESDESANRLLTRSQLFLNPKINANHKLTSVIMFETNEEVSDYISLNNSRLASVLLKDPAVDGQFRYYDSKGSVNRSVGGLGQVFYSFKDRYLTTLNARMDGVSLLGRQSRWGFFPSVSFGWRFSEEAFIKQYSFINDSKLRFSYGLTGNLGRLKEYSRHATYGTVTDMPNQYTSYSALFPRSIQLDKVKWETVTQWNVGLDLALFNNRFDLTFEVYEKLTSDILWKDYDIPSSSGYSDLDFFNGGKIMNQGWEFLFRLYPVRNENFSVRLDFNISHNVNKYLEFPNNFNPEQSVTLGNGEYPRRANIGEPIGSFYGLEWLGVYPDEESVVVMNENNQVIYDAQGKPLKPVYTTGFEFGPGDAIYADQNHDGVIDLLDVVYLGDANPEFEGGFGIMFTYKKRLTASMHFHGRFGYEIVNQIAIETQSMSDRENQSKAVLKRWRKPGDEFPGILPRAYMGHPANSLGSDRFVEDGSFFRLNSITVKYSVPKKISKKIGLDDVDVALSSRKLYIWTNYTGQDPEIRRSTNPFWMGADEGRTPPPTTYFVTLMIKF